MNNLEWRDGNYPVSTRFNDPYYSVADGRAETDHVFIKGNDLTSRWAQPQDCTIAELGFGTGLNFLETIKQWQKHNLHDALLNFISFEQFPITKQEMQRALSHWPELADPTNRLLDIWAPEKTIEVDFSQHIHLTVHIGDANTLLPNVNFSADAWYLDGFSPAKNPELWNGELMLEVGQHTAENGTFATYTAAGFVKRGLKAAGFDVEKVKGFGRKREMLIGRKTEKPKSEPNEH